MKFYTNIFEQIISLENLFLAWEEFKKDKLKKKDVLVFEWELEKLILELHRSLKYHTYKHGVYTSFIITDPKQRIIHKAIVRDRVLHHAISRIIVPLFEPMFIANSFSCRIGKGSHKGIDALAKMINSASKNHTRVCYVLKCDIKKFFNSVDHKILLALVKRKISDSDTMWLLEEIVQSFGKSSICTKQIERERERERERAIPACGRNLFSATQEACQSAI